MPDRDWVAGRNGSITSLCMDDFQVNESDEEGLCGYMCMIKLRSMMERKGKKMMIYGMFKVTQRLSQKARQIAWGRYNMLEEDKNVNKT